MDRQSSRPIACAAGAILSTALLAAICVHGAIAAPPPAKQVQLSTSAVPVTDNASWDVDSFVVNELGAVVRWEITYHIFNQSGTSQISATFAADSYGPELTVESATAISGTVVLGDSDEEGYAESVEWSGFSLGPWGDASLTVVVRTSSSSGQQEYASCGDYSLNAGLLAQYRVGAGGPVRELRGGSYSVRVPCVPFMRLTMSSPEVEWMLRKPGDYYVKAFSGTITSNSPVVVTFSDFADLERVGTGQALSVYYSLQPQHPRIDEWLTPSRLNATFLRVTPSEEPEEWSLWQRVVAGDQSVGTYTGGGVITFTISNAQETIN